MRCSRATAMCSRDVHCRMTRGQFGFPARNAVMSAPTQNARPAALSSTARTSGREESSVTSASSAESDGISIGLPRSPWVRTRWATPRGRHRSGRWRSAPSGCPTARPALTGTDLLPSGHGSPQQEVPRVA